MTDTAFRRSRAWATAAVVLLATTARAGPLTAIPANCDNYENDVGNPQMRPFMGRCYFIEDVARQTWGNAQTQCRTAFPSAMNLVSIHHPIENWFVWEGAGNTVDPDDPAWRTNDGTISGGSGNGVSVSYGSGVYALPASTDLGTFGPAVAGLGCRDNLYGWGANNAQKGVCWIGIYQAGGGGGGSDVNNPDGFTWLDGSEWMDFRSFWGYNEPNNVGGSGENCVHNWDRQSHGPFDYEPPIYPGNWNDEPCSNNYPYVCVAEADCDAGYYKSLDYYSGGINTLDYRVGECTQCAEGRYREFGMESCELCPAGVYGTYGSVDDSCTAPCTTGYYCDVGATPSTQQPCPAGRYGTGPGAENVEGCTVCEAGYYCTGVTARAQCPATTCGTPGDETAACSGVCDPGYLCSAGSACAGLTGVDKPAQNCGDDTVYCQNGIQYTVQNGYYSTGGTSATRTGELICPPGYYCLNGVRELCPPGTYASASGTVGIGGCQQCSAGFFCGEGSTSPTQNDCGIDPVNPQTVFCEAGATANTTVQAGYYSVPESSPLGNREGELPCPEDKVCFEAIAYDKITWNAGSCNSEGKAYTTVAEMTAAGPASAQIFLVDHNAALDEVSDNPPTSIWDEYYTVAYEIVPGSVAFHDAGVPDCEPTTDALNGNIWQVNAGTGQLEVLRSDLQYEVCSSPDVRYTMTVRATATGTNTPSPSTSVVECELEITVDDQNDQPYFDPATPQYREIAEKTDKNTRVVVCDKSTDCVAAAGGAGGPTDAIQAVDEDEGNTFIYSITPGVGTRSVDPNDWKFFIDPCSGFIYVARSGSVSFLGTNPHIFEVVATDDGNGGRFPSLNTTQMVYIYVLNENDPPVLATPSPTYDFTVKENSPEGTLLTPSTVGYSDEDGDTVTLSYTLPNGETEFFLDSVTEDISVTATGATNLDFESSKKQYTITVFANDGTVSVNQDYVVQLVDSNDAPEFVGGTAFYLVENPADDSIVCRSPTGVCVLDHASSADAVTTSDPDAAANTADPTDVTTYRLAGGATDRFQINATSGQISIVNGETFDFENADVLLSGTKRGYTVVVEAMSSGDGVDVPAIPRGTNATVTIYLVNVNEAPAFTNGANPTVSAPEYTPPGTEVLGVAAAVTVADPDNGAGSPEDPQLLTFSLSPDNDAGALDGATHFSVSTSPSGDLQITAIKQLSALTANAAVSCPGSLPCYQLVVRVQDNGGPALYAEETVTIEIVDTNDAPYWDTATLDGLVLTMPELTPGLETQRVDVTNGVGLSGEDDDAGDALSYAVVGGNGESRFGVTSAGGNAFTIFRYENITLNFEDLLTEYLLTVRVYDQGPPERVGTACAFDGFTVVDNCGDGGASCEIADSRCYETCFDTDLGALAAAIPRTETYFCDYPVGHTPLNQTLRADFADYTFTINVGDVNDPPFIDEDVGSLSAVDVSEDLGECLIGSTLLLGEAENLQIPFTELYAFDEDAGAFATVAFTWSEVDPGSEFWSTFDLDTNSGQISRPPGAFGSLTLGYQYNGTVAVSDGFGGTAECGVAIKVIVDNVSPTFDDPTPVSIDENTPFGVELYSELGNFTKIDINTLTGDVLTFSTSYNPRFNLDQATSRLTTGSTPFDFESQQQFTLVVRVSDLYGGEDTADVVVNVNDVNESPYWTPSEAVVTIDLEENSPDGTNVGAALTTLAADLDSGPITSYHTLSFSLVGCAGDAACPFEIANAATGQITVTGSPDLDFEGATTEFNLVARVTDGPGLFADKPLLVRLTDVNEPPSFIGGAGVQTVDEDDDAVDKFLLDMALYVQDPDDDVSALTFSITAGNDDALFDIRNGQLFVNGTLDYEAGQSYSLSISVNDTADNTASDTVQVDVNNVNDVQITDVAAAAPLSCSSPSSLVITGRNFGLVSQSPAATVVVSLRRSNADGSEPPAIVLTNPDCAVTASNTEITCSVPPSIGQSLKVNVTVTVPSTDIAADAAAEFQSSVRFESPVVTDVVDPSALSTAGSETVVLTGACLGTASDALDFGSTQTSVKYCRGATCYQPTGCATTADNEITCSTVPGLGAGLTWQAEIAGQLSAVYAEGSYAAPAVTGLSVSGGADVPTDGELLPGQPLVVTGTNFGGLGVVPDAVSLVYDYASSVDASPKQIVYAVTGCAVTVAYTEIRCTGTVGGDAGGVGSDLHAMVTFSGLTSAVNTAQTVDFASASIDSFLGDGVSGGSTRGGELVVVRGSNFGPECGVPGDTPCDYVSASYTRGSVRASNASEVLVYTPDCAVVTNDNMVCTTEAGTGAGHVWTFRVASADVAPSTAGTTSYANPIVGAYEGEGAIDALTSGGQTVVLRGANFGPVDGAAVTAQYGQEDIGNEFIALNCQVTFSHERIVCTTNQGAGEALAWEVVVDDLLSTGELTYYAAPRIDAFSGAAVSTGDGYMNPDGAETIVLTGANFGPAVPPHGYTYLESVFFGPAGSTTAFEATGCTVVDHDTLSCVTPPGVGGPLYWSTIVKGQSSSLSAATTSYTPPTLASASTTTASSSGGDLIRLTGRGFGLCDPNAKVRVLFDSASLPVLATYDANGVAVDPAVDCPISTEDRQIEFAVPEMTTTSSATLSFRITSTQLTTALVSNGTVAFNYDPPFIDSIFAEPGNVVDSVLVTITGENFCASEACCTTFVDGLAATSLVTSHSHTRIVVEASSAGSISVVCQGNVASNVKSFNTNSPFVLGTVPEIGNQDWQTKGGLVSGESFEIWGLYFGSEAPNVTVGGVDAPLISHGEVACNAPGYPSTADDFTFDPNVGCFKTVVYVPEGSGVDLPMVVFAGNQASNPDNADFEFLSYLPPVITTPSGLGISAVNPTLGGNVVSLVGTNFGPNGTVAFGTAGLSCGEPIVWDHELITCVVPPGEGSSNLVSVTTGGVQSNLNGDVRYAPPSNLQNTFPSLLYTDGRETFVVEGENFGRPYVDGCSDASCSATGPVVAIDGRACVVTQSNHTHATCRAPEGEGTGLALTVAVADQSATAGFALDYFPPTVTSILPLTGPTSGLDAEGNQIYLEIFGNNFGMDRLKVEFAGFTVAERFLDFDLNSFEVETNHTYVKLKLPAYYGEARDVVVEVDGQSSGVAATFDYLPPEVGNVTTTNRFGVTAQYEPGSFSVSNTLGRSAFNNSEVGEPAGYGTWTSSGIKPECLVDRSTRGFYKEGVFVDADGAYVVTHEHYEDDQCVTTLLYTAVLEGVYTDLDVSDDFAGGRAFRDTLSSLVLTPANSQVALRMNAGECVCPGVTWTTAPSSDVKNCALTAANDCPFLNGFYGDVADTPRVGTYAISLTTDLYIGNTVKESARRRRLQTVTSIVNFPNVPTAVVSNPSLVVAPSGPTDGCYIWESQEAYLNRATPIIEATSVDFVPRICEQPALIEITGSNFGSDVLDEEDALQIVLFDPYGGEEFVGSTTTSKGTHPEKCTAADGCVHEDDRIVFRVPFGSGAGLSVKIVLGNTETVVPAIFFNYEPPVVTSMLPGSIAQDLGFVDSNGQNVLIRGANFGGKTSEVSVLINGRACGGAEWVPGDADEGGQSYVSCTLARDVVGPKSIFLYVANQTVATEVDPTDVAVLLAGEADGAWTTTASDALKALYQPEINSMAVSRCPQGFSGQMYGLCVECPEGAVCDGTFHSPPAQETFFQRQIPIFNEDGTVNDRAIERCAADQVNPELIAEFPDLVVRETCSEYVRCEPIESCQSNNVCASEYQYAYPQCADIRSNPEFDNSCSISLDPLTGEYKGNHADCTGNTAVGESCTSANPEECSSCQVLYTNSSEPFGQCTCDMPNRCGLCTMNTHYRLNGECVECPNNPALLIAMFFLAAVAVVAAGYILEKRKFNLAFVSIGVDYFQVLAIFASSKVLWPQSLVNIFNFFSIFNFNIDITAPECLAPEFSYELKWWFTMALPLAVAAVLLCIHGGYSIVKLVRYGTQSSFTSHLSKLIGIYITLFYFLYLAVTKRALDVLNCNAVDPDDGYLYATFTSLECDGGGLCRCDEPGGIQLRLKPLSFVFLGLYTAGFPLFIGYVIYKNRLSIMEDQYLRAHDIGDSRETNPYAYDLRKRYSKMYYHFKPEYYYWILLILARKFWIAFAALMFRGNGSFQLAVILLVLFAAFVIQVLRRPYMSTGERPAVLNELDARIARAKYDPDYALYVNLKTKLDANIKMAGYLQRKNKTKLYRITRNAGNMWKKQSMATTEAIKNLRIRETRSQAARRYFFDYNTVEMVLLACSILISLSGIMFESGRFDEREDLRAQRDTITYIALGLIIFSIVYYFTVFLSEMGVHWLDWLFMFLSNDKAEDRNEEDLDAGLTMEENAMFASPGVQFANAEELEKQLEAVAMEVQAEERKNKDLRDDVRRLKMAAQVDEASGMQGADLSKGPKKQRKQFGQARV